MQQVNNNFDDEIDLFELLKVLWGWKYFLLGLVLSFVVISYAGFSYFYPRLASSTAIVSLSFDGIEKHRYPDGSNFYKDDLITPRILSIAGESVGQSFPTVNELELDLLMGNITVEALFSEAMKRKIQDAKKSGAVVEVFPYQYTLSIRIPTSNEVSDDVMSSYIGAVVDAFRDTTKNRYRKSPLASVDISKDFLATYDYRDIQLLFSKRSTKLIAFLKDRVKRIGYFRSIQNGETFENLLYEVSLLNAIDLKAVETLISNKLITRRPDEMINAFEKRIEDLTRNYNKSLEKSKIARTLFVELQNRRDNSNIDVNSRSEDGTTVVDGSFIDKMKAESAQAYLLQTTLESQVASSDASVDIDFYRSRIQKLKNSERDATTKKDVSSKEVESSLQYILAKLTSCIDRANTLNAEYIEGQYRTSVRVVGDLQSGIVRDKSLPVVLVMVAMCSLMLGFLVVFIAEAIRNKEQSAPRVQRPRQLDAA